MNKIEFFNKKTGKVITDTDDYYFVMNNKVYSDNGKSYESQEPTVIFEDFIEECPDLDWRVINE